MDLSYICNCARMDLFADRLIHIETALGMARFRAYRDTRIYEWTISAMDLECGATYAINSIVDGFRRKYKEVEA